MKFQDQIKRTIILEHPPKRIISLVPSLTELLVDLGLEARVVGLTKFCVHPKGLMSKKTIIGGTKKVNLTKIKGLQPDLIIANKEENTQEMIKTLQEVAPVYVSDIVTINDLIDFIQAIGLLSNIANETAKFVNKLQNEILNFKTALKNRETKRVAYFIWSNPWMVVGGHTYIDQMLALNKLENAFASMDRYPVIQIEELKYLKLDLVLLSSEPYPFKEKHLEEFKKHLDCPILFVDGEFFSWYGSRLIKALSYFKNLSL